MLCPKCGTDGNIVLDTVPKSDYIRRRRKCHCSHRWTTFEMEGVKSGRYYTMKSSITQREERTKEEQVKYHLTALHRLGEADRVKNLKEVMR